MSTIIHDCKQTRCWKQISNMNNISKIFLLLLYDQHHPPLKKVSTNNARAKKQKELKSKLFIIIISVDISKHEKNFFGNFFLCVRWYSVAIIIDQSHTKNHFLITIHLFSDIISVFCIKIYAYSMDITVFDWGIYIYLYVNVYIYNGQLKYWMYIRSG